MAGGPPVSTLAASWQRLSAEERWGYFVKMAKSSTYSEVSMYCCMQLSRSLMAMAKRVQLITQP